MTSVASYSFVIVIEAIKLTQNRLYRRYDYTEIMKTNWLYFTSVCVCAWALIYILILLSYAMYTTNMASLFRLQNIDVSQFLVWLV